MALTQEKTLILAYIPVVHQGYVLWLKKYPQAEILVMGQSLTANSRPLQKDIRALAPEQIVASLKALNLGQSVRVAEIEDLKKLSLDQEILLPDEMISRGVAEEFLTDHQVKFETIFLRWDGVKATQAQPVAVESSTDFMTLARLAAGKSADWWRQVGAVIVKNGSVILTAHNVHLPSEQQPYIDGDPRADFHQGDHIELSTALHAEASLIAQAAKQGLSLAETSLYVTTFPCPNCAKLIVASGIKELFFTEGYSVLDGQRVLETAGVMLIKVN